MIRNLSASVVIIATLAQLTWSQDSIEPTDRSEHDALLAPYREPALRRWSRVIEKLEDRDAAADDPVDGILFIGSSSIRLWTDIAIDMSPYRPIQRGYGGARYSDLAVFAERLIEPHQYRALVCFVANDITGSPRDNSPAEVEKLVRYIVSVSRQHRPDAPVLLVDITPTESRWQVWPEIRRVNAVLREIALSTPDTYFVATAEHYLSPDNQPRPEYFLSDRLHLNSDGYDLWSRLIRRRLDDVLRDRRRFHAQITQENR